MKSVFGYKLDITIVGLSLLCFYPFIAFYSFDITALRVMCFLFLLALFAFRTCLGQLRIKKRTLLFLCLTIIPSGFWLVSHGDSHAENQLIHALSAGIMILLLERHESSHKKLLRHWANWNTIQVLLIVCGLPMLLLGFISPYRVIEYGDQIIRFYGMFNIKVRNPDDWSLRSGGFYDEPGSLILMIWLVGLLCRHSNVIVDLFQRVGSIVAMSFAWIFMVFHDILERGWRRVAVLCILIVGLYPIASEDDYIKSRTLERAELMVSGYDAGRSAGLEMGPTLLRRYMFSGISMEELNAKHPSFVEEIGYTPFILFGLIGGAIYLAPLLLAFKGMKWLEVLVTGLFFWQRPFLYFPPILVLLYFLYNYGTEDARSEHKEPKPSP